MFLPSGSGGEEQPNAEANWRYDATELNPVSQDITSNSAKRLPTYAIVEPNRAIETQTDPERLTLLAPTSGRANSR